MDGEVPSYKAGVERCRGWRGGDGEGDGVSSYEDVDRYWEMEGMGVLGEER